MAALIQSHRSAQEPIGVLDVFTRNLGFYTGAPRMQLFGVEQAGLFLHSPSACCWSSARLTCRRSPLGPG